LIEDRNNTEAVKLFEPPPQRPFRYRHAHWILWQRFE